MTQQELMQYLNRLTVGYRLIWDDVKYDADKAINKINDYLGTCYPDMSDVMIAPHSTYSIIVKGKPLPIFPKRYIISIVIPYIASEVLARDEEFTTIYNKYLVEVEEGLYNMFQNEFNKVPPMFRQDKDEGVFFAVDHPLHKVSMHKQNIPEIRFNIHYHINNPDIDIIDTFVQDLNTYKYGETVEVQTIDNTFIHATGAYAYEFKCWSYDIIDLNNYAEDEIKITSDVHLYALWNKIDTLQIADGVVSIKDDYNDKLTRLIIPKYIGNEYVTTIGPNCYCDCTSEIMLPQINLTIDTDAFKGYKGKLILPRYDYIRNSPNITIKVNAIGVDVYTYLKEGAPILYLPYSVKTIESNGVASTKIECEIEKDSTPIGWATDCFTTDDVTYGVSNG